MNYTVLFTHITHILTVILLGYLTRAILMGKRIPKGVGIVTGLLAILTIVLYYNTVQQSKLQGLSFDPNDPRYKPIGGVGGVGWV